MFACLEREVHHLLCYTHLVWGQTALFGTCMISPSPERYVAGQACGILPRDGFRRPLASRGVVQWPYLVLG